MTIEKSTQHVGLLVRVNGPPSLFVSVHVASATSNCCKSRVFNTTSPASVSLMVASPPGFKISGAYVIE